MGVEEWRLSWGKDAGCRRMGCLSLGDWAECACHMMAKRHCYKSVQCTQVGI